METKELLKLIREECEIRSLLDRNDLNLNNGELFDRLMVIKSILDKELN